MLRLLTASLLALSLALACGSSPDGSADLGPDVPLTVDAEPEVDTAPEVDAAPVDAEPEVEPVRRLEFVDAFGDDQKSCDAVDTCTFSVSGANERVLRVRYEVDGVPAGDEAIVFEVIDDPWELGHLLTTTVYTGADGLAAAVLQVSLTCITGTFKVKVSVADHPTVAPLFFVIHSMNDCLSGYLTVSFVYHGTKAFDGVSVYLFKSGQPPVADLACANLDPIGLLTADLQKGPHQLSQTAKFTMLPGLEDEKEQFYTIVARGELVDYTPIAFGCNDTDGSVNLTGTKHVTITLEDLPCAEGICCDLACDAGAHCAWTLGQMACVDDPCSPPECAADTHCEAGACVPNVCAPGCAVAEYCDDLGQCQALPCEATCTEAELGDGPVCGTDCLDYVNPCAARCAGVDTLHPGACLPGCGCCGTCAACASEPCLDPVCGNDGNTYPSLCTLELCHAGVGAAYAGFCVPDDACGCSTVSQPVCGSLPGEEEWQTLPNGCTATCLGATVWFEGICTCCDPSGEAPVCAYNALFGWTAMRNQCVVDSLGTYTASYPGACVCCGAPGSVDGCCDLTLAAPVCGADGITYANDCALTCADVAKESDGVCPCPAVYEPVCGQSLLEPGKTFTYPNACVARSLYGVTATTPGACPLCTTICAGEDPEPVCGQDGVTYPNWCALLKCNGDAVTKGLAEARCYGDCGACR